MIELLALGLEKLFLIAPAALYALPAAALFFLFNANPEPQTAQIILQKEMAKPAIVESVQPKKEYTLAKVISKTNADSQWILQKWRRWTERDWPPGILIRPSSQNFAVQVFRGSLKFRAPPGEAFA